MFDYTMILKPIIVATAVAVGIASYKYFGMKPDNVVEQTAESVIKEETGATVDLSPENQDTKK